MTRVALSRLDQTVLLTAAKRQLAMPQFEMARMCGVHPRTFSDWMRGKSRMRYDALERLAKHCDLLGNATIKQLPEFSHVRKAAKLGALRRNSRHGNPGTPEGRRLGGLRSIAKRRLMVEHGNLPDGFIFAKTIVYPGHSPLLAEFMGMMLGDGCLCSAYQAGFYFNTETDAEYASFMEKTALQLFGIAPRWKTGLGGRCGALLFSSKRFVDYLISLGFGRGDKVKTQAGVPSWILKDRVYRQRCLRGLMDTDGSFYRYQHQVYGRSYVHTALCFTNRSHPLLQFMKETLRSCEYSPTIATFRVYLYQREDIERYFAEIGSHNPKHLDRYQAACQVGTTRLRRGTQVVDGAAFEMR